MKSTQPVIRPVRHSLGDGGNAVKYPAAQPLRISCWILRSAQNDLRWLLLALCSLLLAPCSKATELTDLGQGLAYLRIHSVAGSEVAIRKAVPGAGALVLDLRYATASDESAAILKSALTGRPTNVALFILVSPETPPVLTLMINSSAALILGAPGSVPTPKVVVQTDATTDRHAYDALDAGTALEKLISGKIEKERFDEATLVQEFKNGHPDAAPLPGGRPGPTPANPPAGTVSPDPTVPKPTGTPEKPTPLTDRVLQRAVHLHRALLALKAR